MTGPSKRSGDCPFAATAYKQEKRQSTFDPTAQNVSTTGTHAWVAPNLAAGDQRGPCPGLNALANHGYLPHNGVADITTIVQATNTGMRRDHCAIMLMGNAFDGGPVQPRTIGLDQSVQMTKQLVWDLDGLV